MATSNTNTTRNFLRQIVFDNLFTAEEKKNFVLNSGVSVCTIGTVKCSATLYEIVFANEMYSPSHLTVKFNLVPDGENLPSYQDIVKYFLKEKVSIQRGDNNPDNPKYETIDTNYYVHEVRPTYVNAGISTKDDKEKKKVVLYLDIFSADKLLTLDKYSKSYVDKSLFGDIISKEVESLTNEIGFSFPTQDYSSRLKYGEVKTEIKHPYLVQYNESFYDFLIRTANRTGEFLYFTDGHLTLGVKTDTVNKVENYNSLAVESRNNSVLSTTGISRNYSLSFKDKGEKHEKSSGVRRYTQPTSNDDYLVVYEKDEFDSFGEEYNPKITLPAGAFKTLLTTSTIGAFVKAMLVDSVLIEGGKALENVSDVNKSYNEKVFKTKDLDTIGEHAKTVFSGTYLDSNAAAIDKWDVNANADFYNKIDECEKKMGSRTITLTLKGDDVTNYQVGQLIEVEGAKYVVTHVNYSEVFDGRSLREEYVIKALPLLNVKVDASTHKLVLLLTDESSTSEQNFLICCPAALPEEKRIRKAASQTAWVVDSDDPKYLGRVRIRYAWDATEDVSPWIRQAEPAAGKGGGVNFRLYEDDEVMIGYENDNIEQPYIIGALYHGKDDGIDNRVPVGRNKKAQNTHVIRTRSGHQMVISEKKNFVTFMANMNPTLKYVNLFTDWIKNFLNNPKVGSELAGGFQFNDKYGIYNVTMSTDQRLISIASPLGNIKLSAFSGISISAPRGDISIVGKNVSIKAANKLTLESGENAKLPGNKIFNEGISKIGQDLLSSTVDFLASAVDLSVLRHTIEVFSRPVDGTLQIKSNRYLLLEAGKGNALIPRDGFQDDNVTLENKDKQGSFEKYYGSRNKTKKIVSHINFITELIIGESVSYRPLITKLKTAKDYFIFSHPYLDQGTVKTSDDCYRTLCNHLTERNFDKRWLRGDADAPDGSFDQFCESYAEPLFNAMKALKQALDNRPTKKKSHWISFTGWFMDLEFGKALTKAEEKYRNLTQNIYVMPRDHADIDIKKQAWDDIISQRVISSVVFEYLKSLRDNGPVKILKQSGGNTIDVPEDDNAWIGFLKQLSYAKAEDSVFGNLFADNIEKKFWKNFAFWDNAKENFNWGNDRASCGRVLLSDQDKTYYFNEDGQITPSLNPTITEVLRAVETALKKENDRFRLFNDNGTFVNIGVQA